MTSDFTYRLKALVRPVIVRAYRLRLAMKPVNCSYLFIMGHMRSGSTLMTHILNSHPDFIGYAESNTVYRNEGDLTAHLIRVHIVNRKIRMQSRYVVDQINHNEYVPDADFLGRYGIYTLYLIRCPEPALASIMRLMKEKGWGESRALDYYVGRLAMLRRYAARRTRDRQAFITYEQLLNTTDNVFRLIREWTCVEQPLCEMYQSLHTTGRKSDPSETIHTGRIERRRSSGDPVPLHEETRIKAQSAYDDAFAELSARCRSLRNNSA